MVVPLTADLAASGYLLVKVKDRNRQHADEVLGAAVVPLSALQPVAEDPAQVQADLKAEAAKRAAAERAEVAKAEAEGEIGLGTQN